MLHRNMNIPRLTTTGRFRPEALFRPGSVAVIGAETEAGSQVMANLLAGGFQGAVLPVGAGLTAVSGVLAYPDIDHLPIAPDLALVCRDGGGIEAIFSALARRGTHVAVVTGMADGVAAAAAAAGVRAMGPGSFGISVPAIGLNATRSHVLPRAGRVALVSQSAALCRAVLDWAEPNGVGFSHVVGIGGNADLGFAPVLDWLSRDPGTGAILLDIRLIRDRRRFLSAARAAARLRPVVAMRAGGRLADPSGAADAAFVAALRRCGVLCVDRLEDLLAAAETLTRARPARNEALAIVTNAIGPAQLAADAALRDGLTLASLSDQTRQILQLSLPRAFAPAGAGVAAGMTGDIVYVGTDAPMRLAEAAALLAGAREVGGVLIVHAPTGEADQAGIAAIAAAGALKVPLLVCVMGETTGAAHRRMLAEAGVPVFASPEQAVRGFLHLVQDRRNRAAARELPPSTVLRLAPDRSLVQRLLAGARGEGHASLTQDEAMAVLAAYGVPAVPARVVQSAADAADAAALLGYPVVIKRRRRNRDDADQRTGVMLDLHDPAQVAAAAGVLGAGGEGLLVQRQVARARELLIAVGEDATFGPIIQFGQGGTAAAILRDVAVDLPPLNLSLAHALIARTRAARTLEALHDLPAADADAVADTLVRVSQLIVDFPEIAALEINPLFVDRQGVVAADAWIRLRPADERPARLAIPPYPAELTSSFATQGESLVLRPIRPEDAAAHGRFFARLSPEDIRYRFFTAMRALSPEQMARMTQIDYEREMAFVAVRERPEAEGGAETVGVARLVCENDQRGEFAVVVQPDMKGRGLARALMGRLVDWGRMQGLGEIAGQVLAENQPMLAFMRRLGFTIHRLPGEDDVVEALLTL
jgi:acetyltransferase